jgi:DNA-binding Xre family transcriptional regulator
MKIYDDIASGLEQVILDQLWLEMYKQKLTKGELATILGVKLVNLSRLGKTRPLTPEYVRRIMEALEYRPSVISKVEKEVQKYNNARKSSRFAFIYGQQGLGELAADCLPSISSAPPAVLIRLRRGKKTKSAEYPVAIVIEPKGRTVSYSHLQNEEITAITGHKAAQLLLPDHSNAVALLIAKVFLTLHQERVKTFFNDLSSFDRDELIISIRTGRLRRQHEMLDLLDKATEIFAKHVENKV